MQQINTFKHYYKKKYGRPVGKIALDFGTVCPNRKKGGCVFCSPVSFTPFYLSRGDNIPTQVAKGKSYLKGRGFDKFFAYLQQETPTAAPLEEFTAKSLQAVSDPDCVGLIVSTRPDAVGNDVLEFLAKLAEKEQLEILIELGLQSAHNRTLRFLNRNHTFEDFEDAVNRIHRFKGLEPGVHLILGLPNEEYEDQLDTLGKVCGLGVGSIKFHHLQIIVSTRLQEIHMENSLVLYSAHEYLYTLARLLSHTPKNIVIHRLWSSSPPDMIVEPKWNLSVHELNGILKRIMSDNGLFQGKNPLP